MKRWLVLSLTLTFLALPGKSQYIPSQSFDKPVKDYSGEYWHWGNTFQHLDVALSLGTSGIGIELAAPVCEFAQVRLGYEFMPHFKKSLSADLMIGNEKAIQYDEKTGYRKETSYDEVRDFMYGEAGYDLRDHIDMTSRLNMQNFKFLVDIFPLANNKKLHFTVGFYWGPSEYAKIESDAASNSSIACVDAYNKYFTLPDVPGEIAGLGTGGFVMGKFKSDIKDADGKIIAKAGDTYKMTGGSKGSIMIPVKVNSFKPYLGVGYESNLLKKRNDIKFAITGGLMFWGGTPSMYTPDGVDLVKDVDGLTGNMDSYVKWKSKLKAYPAITFRIIKNIF